MVMDFFDMTVSSGKIFVSHPQDTQEAWFFSGDVFWVRADPLDAGDLRASLTCMQAATLDLLEKASFTPQQARFVAQAIVVLGEVWFLVQHARP
jgi:hypothetical protein